MMKVLNLTLIIFMLAVVKGQSGDDDAIDKYSTQLGKPYKTCYLDGNAKCQSNGQDNLLDETWIKDCHRCACYDDLGVMCCDMIKLPTDWPPDCFPKVDRETCTVHLKSIHKPQLNCSTRRKSIVQTFKEKYETVANRNSKKNN